MWIVPSTISHSAPGTEASTLDSEQFSQLAERSLMWRSKHSLARTWLQRWKREDWIRLLSGRTCAPSTPGHTEDTLTFSVEDFLVNRSAKREVEEQMKILDTCFQRSNESSTSADQTVCSLKTSKESFLPGFKEPSRQAYLSMSWSDWRAEVTRVRGECSARKRSAHRTEETESSSSLFATPTVTANQTSPSMMKHPGCRALVENTPKKIWPTASSRDWKDTPGMSTVRADRTGNARAADQLPRAVFKHDGLQAQAKSNTDGKSLGQLNANWVEQLMGIPVGWTHINSEQTDSDS